MNNTTTNIERMPADVETTGSLYRMTFTGGPFDGHVTDAGCLPEADLRLASGPAGCQTKAGTATMPRWAHYRLHSVQLVVTWSVPMVLCRFDYQGTTIGAVCCPTRWWRRRLEAFWRWLEPRPSETAPNFMPRSISRVQN